MFHSVKSGVGIFGFAMVLSLAATQVQSQGDEQRCEEEMRKTEAHPDRMLRSDCTTAALRKGMRGLVVRKTMGGGPGGSRSSYGKMGPGYPTVPGMYPPGYPTGPGMYPPGYEGPTDMYGPTYEPPVIEIDSTPVY